MAITFSYAAAAYIGAGAAVSGREVARPGRPRRSQMAGALGTLGYGVGMMFGHPHIGMWIGIGVGTLLFQEEKRRIIPPEEKRVELSPQTLVTSNISIPLGFGTFYAVGNVLDFKIEREYYYWTGPDSEALPDTDARTYFFAVGICQNSAEISEGRIGNLVFTDITNILSTEYFPDGGRSIYPDEARSDYYFYQSVSSNYFKSSGDSGWVSFFAAANSVLRIQVGGDTTTWCTAQDMEDHMNVYVYRKVGGVESVQKLEASDWSGEGTSIYRTHMESNVVKGDYRITFEMDEWMVNRVNNSLVILRDNTSYDEITWTYYGDSQLIENVFQSNWFALKFNDDDIAPEDANFYLIYNQGETNPIVNLKEYLTNIEWGLGIPSEKIDTTSFDALEATCDSESRTFNGLFTSQTNPIEIINQFLITAHALMVYSEGKFKLIENIFAQPAKTFQESNTIRETFQFSGKNTNEQVSRLKVEFEDSSYEYNVRSVLFDDLDLIEKIGIKDTSQFLTGVNAEAQALTVGAYLFRNMKQRNVATFKASINDADIEPGDMIEVIRPAIQYGDVMRIIGVSEEPNEEFSVSAVSYFPEDEQIVLTTEDDFRAGTCAGNVEIKKEEDGEVYCGSVTVPVEPNDWLQLREHRDVPCGSAATNEVFSWSTDHLKINSATAKAGCGYAFVQCDVNWLTDGRKIEITWRQEADNANVYSRVWIRDAAYDRTSGTDFPDSANLADDIIFVQSRQGKFIQATNTYTISYTSAPTGDFVTLMIAKQNWANVYGELRVLELKILETDDTVLKTFTLNPVTWPEGGSGREEYGYTGTGG